MKDNDNFYSVTNMLDKQMNELLSKLSNLVKKWEKDIENFGKESSTFNVPCGDVKFKNELKKLLKEYHF